MSDGRDGYLDRKKKQESPFSIISTVHGVSLILLLLLLLLCHAQYFLLLYINRKHNDWFIFVAEISMIDRLSLHE